MIAVRDDDAVVAWTVLMGLGLVLVIVASLGAALRGWDTAHHPRRPALTRAAAAAALGLGLFVLGLWRA
ncbi:MAG: hypothetical protein IPF99_30060 [Deltaproteobacteria bacterium]|nr:hypothetical protein [Deltaproteobacteria bacterium]